MYSPQEKVKATADTGTLTLRFVPAGMKAGAAVSLIALVFCIMYTVWTIEKKKAEDRAKAQD